MISPLARRLRLIGVILCAGAFLALLAFAWAWQQFQKSLPLLDGEWASAGLGAPVYLHRDALGTVTIKAGSEADAHQALGFAHGQDRFFQMDLARRRAAGELAALVGAAALPLDRQAVIHRLRPRAAEILAELPPEHRDALVAYARGVNDGLASLPGRPWEYRLLRTPPAPWQPEDSLLAGMSLAFTLQDAEGRLEWDRTILRDQLGQRAVDFFAPLLTPDDAALDGSSAPLGPPPTERAINLRQRRAVPTAHTPHDPSDFLAHGSNFLGVEGSRTTTGAALLAGDPHLDLLLPNTWYRASLAWTDADGTAHRVVGLSLPGVPGIVIGSNGHLAWTFTNSYADTGDLVQIELNPTAPEMFYMERNIPREFDRRTDTIQVRRGRPETVNSTWTLWGPIMAQPPGGRPFAHRWVMHEPGAMNMDILRLARTHTLPEALDTARQIGMPAQNILLATHDGQLAWTLAGRLPHRVGFDVRFPTSWAFGDRRWDGLLPADQVPFVLAEPGAYLWSGNQRMLGSEALGLLGDGGYERPYRGARLRDLLQVRLDDPAPVAPGDLLALQLDTAAPWMEPWRDLLLVTLDEVALAGDRRRRELREALNEAPLAADLDAVTYRIVRGWIRAVRQRTLTPIFERNTQIAPDWSWHQFNTMPALLHLHQHEDQAHLLAPEYATWRDLRLAAVDDVVTQLRRAKVRPADATWGERNRARIHHPLAAALPRPIRSWFNLPPDPLPGDADLPRVQSPAFGASARLVVSPGYEAEGILHLPGGQSGHPLSPYYRAGHRDWVEGRPTPLLPGEPRHTLTLRP
jgi:penicillin G amidase